MWKYLIYYVELTWNKKQNYRAIENKANLEQAMINREKLTVVVIESSKYSNPIESCQGVDVPTCCQL
jgi:hypothetical protein